MRSKILVVLLLVGAVAPAQWAFSYVAQPFAPIPSSGTGGAAGDCGNPANTQTVTINGGDSVVVTDVDVALTLTHTYASDLRITLSHGGTSVVLFDRHAATGNKDFGGTYVFDDQQGSTIAASVDPNQPVLIPGFYQPHAPLAAFNGLSAAGPWTLELCDLAFADAGVISFCTIDVSAYSNVDVPFPWAVPIEDAGPGGCAAPLTHVINVPAGTGPVSNVGIGCGLIHGRAADLAITLTHGGVTVTLSAPNTPSSPAYLGDIYWFSDDAGVSWDQALALPGVVPTAYYRPDSPFSAFDGVDAAGPWFFTICDAVPGSTGSIYYLTLSYQNFGYEFELLQPSGSSSIVLKNTGGVPGNLYVNAFTLVPGSFPFGWFHGLDISMVELVSQISSGVPFFGVLDASGGATVTIPGPVPANLGVQFTSVQLTPGGVPVASMPARSHTTAP